MDISLYVIGLLVPLILTLLAVLIPAKKAGGILLAGISAIGGLISAYFYLGVSTDGSISESIGSTTIYLTSATLNTFTWYFFNALPLVLAFFGFMAALYRVVEA